MVKIRPTGDTSEELIFHSGVGSFIPTPPEGVDEDMIGEMVSYISNFSSSSGEGWEPPQPSSDSNVWRYLNFTQLLSIFERDQFWFTNVNDFEDPYEGTIPVSNVVAEVDALVEEFEIGRDYAEEVYSVIRGPGSPSVSGAYVNCWNVNEHQSAALWEQYVDSSQGIAIKTTVDKLGQALNDSNRELVSGKVEYIDYSDESIPRGDFPALYHKRESFEHEHEYRISYLSVNEGDEPRKGFYVDVDTGTLIDKIVISPISPGWFTELVNRVLDRYKIDCDLIESGLYSEPDMNVK